MVSDQEIVKGVEILLTQSHPKSFTSLSDVVQQLGEKLGFDLSHKALFIRDQINLHILRSQSHSPSQSQSQYHHQPPQPPPLSKDHFALQHQNYRFSSPPQFQNNNNTHFAIQQHQQQQQRQRHPVEVNFGKPAPPPLQVSPPPEVKVVGQGSGGKSTEKIKKGGHTGTKRRGGPGGLNKLCGITPELQVIVGESALSRTDIVKQLWAYIKKNNLQDPGNKRKIICDDALRVVFETDCTDMFKMNKLLAKHIIRLEPTKESSQKRAKVNDPEAESQENVSSQVIISDALANCLGIGEKEMSQSEALRLVWEYIKVNKLEDPQNSVMILCDEKLKELFGCESISAMGIPELVIRHHLTKQ
ncbi:uncharacterized protein LOC143531387 isoform X2 [Bidens hawaiensis]|uniref:uncharacterized protein LOC143531387 isoform X2 n=1 Tax=Bidens hawaiensis TaxID=980011 RepID=UPI00404B0C24